MPKLKNSIEERLIAEGKVKYSRGPDTSEKTKEHFYKQKILDRKYFPNKPENVPCI